MDRTGTSDDKAACRADLAAAGAAEMSAGFRLMRNATLLGIIGDGVTDISQRLEDELGNGGIYLPDTGLPYMFSRAVRIPSVRVVEHATGARLKRMDNTWETATAAFYENLNIGPNDSDAVGEGTVPENMAAWDHDITVIGGVFDGNNAHNDRVDTNYSPQALTRFRRVKNLKLSGLTAKDSVHFAFLIGRCYDFLVENIDSIDTNRIPNGDLVHIGGDCLGRSEVRDVRRSRAGGDDSISFVTWDGPIWHWTQGPLPNIRMSSLTSTVVTNSGLRLLSANGHYLSAVCEDIGGIYDGSGVMIGDFDLGGANFGPITLNGMSLCMVDSVNPPFTPVWVKDKVPLLTITRGERHKDDVTVRPFLTLVTNPQKHGRVNLVDCADMASSVDRDLVHMRDDAQISVVRFTGQQTAGTYTGRVVRTIKEGGVVGSIHYDDCVISGMESLGASEPDDVLDVSIGKHTQGNGYFVWRSAGQTDVNVAGPVRFSASIGNFGAFGVGPATGPVVQTIRNTIVSAPYGLADYYATGPHAHRLTSGGCVVTRTIDGAGWGVNINPADGGVIVSVSGTDFPTDHTKLTPLNGDQVRDATGLRRTRVSGAWV